MTGRNRASWQNRKQATRIAVLAFVAADCAGIAYVQHRMAREAERVEQLAYGEPLPALATGPAMPGPAPVRAASAPALALNGRVTPVEAAPPAPVRAASAVPAADAQAAPRLAPVVEHGSAKLASAASVRDDAPALQRRLARAVGADAVDSAFASAFTLDGEASEAEHRFGQWERASASGNLADLVVPREEPAPMFDRAGIAPVVGQSAAVDAPAPAAVDGGAPAPEAEELPATKG